MGAQTVAGRDSRSQNSVAIAASGGYTKNTYLRLPALDRPTRPPPRYKEPLL